MRTIFYVGFEFFLLSFVFEKLYKVCLNFMNIRGYIGSHWNWLWCRYQLPNFIKFHWVLLDIKHTDRHIYRVYIML